MSPVNKILGSVRFYIPSLNAISSPRRFSDSSKSGDDNEKTCDKSTYEDSCNGRSTYLCSCDCNPSTPTMYDNRKYGHCLPANNVSPGFETLPQIPTGVFRCTEGETLGKGACKGCYYQCPEYFSFHHMTYYDMHLFLRQSRQPSANTGRKP